MIAAARRPAARTHGALRRPQGETPAHRRWPCPRWGGRQSPARSASRSVVGDCTRARAVVEGDRPDPHLVGDTVRETLGGLLGGGRY